MKCCTKDLCRPKKEINNIKHSNENVSDSHSLSKCCFVFICFYFLFILFYFILLLLLFFFFLLFRITSLQHPRPSPPNSRTMEIIHVEFICLKIRRVRYLPEHVKEVLHLQPQNAPKSACFVLYLKIINIF